MVIASLVYPGTWLSGDSDECRAVESLLHLIDTEFATASVSLGLFNQAVAQLHQAYHADRNAIQILRLEAEKDLQPEAAISPFDREAFARRQINIDLKLLQLMAKNGLIPLQYKSLMPSIHAKSFLFALDTIRKALITMSKYPISKSVAETSLSQLLTALPDLAGVRDSTAHADERAVGVARKRKIVPQPIMNEMIQAPDGGVTILGSLMGNKFSCTTEDGTFGSVEVSIDSLIATQAALQQLLESLPWRDRVFGRVSPST